MPMHPNLLKILEQSDDNLFINGACHIFASALLQVLPEQAYSLRRLRAWNPSSPIEPRLPRPFMEAYHIYAFKNGNAVDVTGTQKEEELLKVWESKSDHPYEFEPVQCSITELLGPIQVGEKGYQVNQWNLIADHEFVTECRRRALEKIKGNRHAYIACGSPSLSSDGSGASARCMIRI